MLDRDGGLEERRALRGARILASMRPLTYFLTGVPTQPVGSVAYYHRVTLNHQECCAPDTQEAHHRLRVGTLLRVMRETRAVYISAKNSATARCEYSGRSAYS